MCLCLYGEVSASVHLLGYCDMAYQRFRILEVYYKLKWHEIHLYVNL